MELGNQTGQFWTGKLSYSTLVGVLKPNFFLGLKGW